MGDNIHRASILKVVRSLEALRRTARGDLHQTVIAGSHELSSYDNHPADQGTDTFRRELDLGLIRGLEERLTEAKRALEKVDEGSYGQCDHCGRPISAARLAARPESVLCMRCAAEAEQRHVSPFDRDPVVPMPYGESGHRTVEATGEDFWNDMAKWGTSDTPQDDPPAERYEEMFSGLDNLSGTVQRVEKYIGADGEVLWEAEREESRRRGRALRQDQQPGEERVPPLDRTLNETPDR